MGTEAPLTTEEAADLRELQRQIADMARRLDRLEQRIGRIGCRTGRRQDREVA